MNNNTQARAPTRMKSKYALGCAALLCVYCLPYSAAAQLEATLEHTPSEVADVAANARDNRSEVAAQNPSRGDNNVPGTVSNAESASRAAPAGPSTALELRSSAESRVATATSGPLELPDSAEAPRRGAQQVAAAKSGASGVVNINTAGATELERLPRIGPARAQAILGLRLKLKQFSRLEQLLQVKGIGRATFRMLRPLLALSGPTTLEHKHGGH